MSRNEKSSSSETYVVFGTAFPEQTEKDKRAGVTDAGQFVPVWKQEARDEKGRRRFHGAFEGGFSAGYFNTVGSKEGWVPSNFVSSRTARNQQQGARPEDFMDEEDLLQMAASRQVVATDEFDVLGGTERELANRKRQLEKEDERGGALGFLSTPLMDLVESVNDSVGIRLLRKMGWKPGQGIGPRQTFKQRQKQGNEEDQEWITDATFAPHDTPIVNFAAKSDSYGVGYDIAKFVPQVAEMRRLREKTKADGQKDTTRAAFGIPSDSGKAGFGVGTYEDDDESDVYGSDMKLRDYHTSLYEDDDHEVKKRSTKRRRQQSQEHTDEIKSKELCNDGRPPLKGFSVSKDKQALGKWHAPPKVPANFTGQRVVTPDPTTVAREVPPVNQPQHNNDSQSGVNIPRRQLTFQQRGEILGEKALESKSVSDYMLTKSQERQGDRFRAANVDRSKLSNGPAITKEAAKLALGGFMPFGDNPRKRERYRKYLENYAGLLTEDGQPKSTLPIPEGMTYEAGMNELDEFAKAARIFRPVSSMMSGRFTSARVETNAAGDPAFAGGLKTEEQWKKEREIKKKEEPMEDTKELSQEAQAAALKMFGDLTRTIKTFHPSKLVCKRFNVPKPHADSDSKVPADNSSGRTQAGSHQALSEESMEKMLRDRGGPTTIQATARINKDDPAFSAVIPKPSERTNPESVAPSTVHTPDVEKEDVPLDYERPSMDIFKAIFENSEDEEEEEKEKEEKEPKKLEGPRHTAQRPSSPDSFIGPPMPPSEPDPDTTSTTEPFRPMFSRPSDHKKGSTTDDQAKSMPQLISEEVVVQPFKPREKVKRRHVSLSDSEQSESEPKSRPEKRKHKEKSHKKRSRSRERHHKKKKKEKSSSSSSSRRRHERSSRARYENSEDEGNAMPALPDDSMWVEKSPPPLPAPQKREISESEPRSRTRPSAADLW